MKFSNFLVIFSASVLERDFPFDFITWIHIRTMFQKISTIHLALSVQFRTTEITTPHTERTRNNKLANLAVNRNHQRFTTEDERITFHANRQERTFSAFHKRSIAIRTLTLVLGGFTSGRNVQLFGKFGNRESAFTFHSGATVAFIQNSGISVDEFDIEAQDRKQCAVGFNGINILHTQTLDFVQTLEPLVNTPVFTQLRASN